MVSHFINLFFSLLLTLPLYYSMLGWIWKVFPPSFQWLMFSSWTVVCLLSSWWSQGHPFFSSLLLWLQQAENMYIFIQFSLFSYCHYGFIFDSWWRFVPPENLLCWGLETVIPLNWVIALTSSRPHTVSSGSKPTSGLAPALVFSAGAGVWVSSFSLNPARTRYGLVPGSQDMECVVWCRNGLLGDEPNRSHTLDKFGHLLFPETLRTEFKVIQLEPTHAVCCPWCWSSFRLLGWWKPLKRFLCVRAGYPPPPQTHPMWDLN